jgi:hypothetical protein
MQNDQVRIFLSDVMIALRVVFGRHPVQHSVIGREATASFDRHDRDRRQPVEVVPPCHQVSSYLPPIHDSKVASL